MKQEDSWAKIFGQFCGWKYFWWMAMEHDKNKIGSFKEYVKKVPHKLRPRGCKNYTKQNQRQLD